MKKTMNKQLPPCFTLIIFIVFLTSCGDSSTGTKTAKNYQVSIDATPTDGGTVSPSGGQYESGETVEISATPSEGWRFVEWTGDYTGQSSTATVTVDKDMNIKAQFTKKNYVLTVNSDGEGTVDEEVVQTKSTDYEHGTVVELTANPSQGWEFIEWQGDLSSSENPEQITVDQAQEVTAVFERIKVSLDINVTGKGSVTIDPDRKEYNANTEVTITAVAEDRWKFSEWRGDTSATDNPLELTLKESKKLEALFEEQQVIYVDKLATGINDGDSWSNAYNSLQPALAEAKSGQEIWVSKGTYFPDRSDKYTSFKLKNNVKIFGGFSGDESSKDKRNWLSNVTILSGEIGRDGKGDNITTIVQAEDLNSGTVLNGFTITGGNTNRSNGAGIDISNSTLEISNLIISDNKALEGGGVYANESELLIKNVEFNDNSVGNGGGVYLSNSNSTIINSKFAGNRVNRKGGAIFNEFGNLEIIDTEFKNNYSNAGGGAIYNTDGESTIIENSFFKNNKTFTTGGGAVLNDDINSLTIKSTTFLSDSTSGKGGALHNYSVDKIRIINCAYAGNYSLSEGGAIYSRFSDNISIVNGVFSKNASSENGGAIYDDRNDISIINNTFNANTAGDRGGGIYFSQSNATIANSILWLNFDGDGPSSVYAGTDYSNTEVHFSNSIVQFGISSIENSIDLGNNSNQKPYFIDPKGSDSTLGTIDDNLRLQSNSPAINNGDNKALDLDGDGNTTDDIPEDLEGNNRIQNGTVDIGAYETNN